MRRATESQPEHLRRLLADPEPAQAAAERLAGRRVQLIGVGTSWHAAHHGAWMLREAGVRAEAAHAADLAPYGASSTAEAITCTSSAHSGRVGSDLGARSGNLELAEDVDSHSSVRGFSGYLTTENLTATGFDLPLALRARRVAW